MRHPSPSPGGADTRQLARRSWWLIDESAAELLVMPAAAGIEVDATLRITDTRSGGVLHTDKILAGQSRRVGLEPYPQLHYIGVSLDWTGDSDPKNATSMHRLAASKNREVHRIVPREWGVDEECIVVIKDLSENAVMARSVIAAGSALTAVLDFPDGRKLQLSLHSIDKGRAGPRLVPSLRLVPFWQRGEPDALAQSESRALAASVRRGVTLQPAELASPGRGGLATFGFIGAWEGDTPVVEAMDYVLGRQRYQFAPHVPDRVVELESTVIYLGLPHNSWGHFLTQGLSRVWYALEHPHIPVVWDGPRLNEHQRQVLKLLGMRNEQMFLTRPTRFTEVIFPYPGLCIGDFVAAEFTDRVGRVRPADMVPGKRLLLSRAKLPGNADPESSSTSARLESVAARHGFQSFSPEEHSIATQLAELSSAEVVLGIEGSAFHSLLLLHGDLRSRYWALTRHRGGSGVYQHIKAAKGLRYETINVLLGERGRAHDELALDLETLDRLLLQTDGLRTNLGVLDGYLERPSTHSTRIAAHLGNTQVTLTRAEAEMVAASGLIKAGANAAAQTIVSSFF